MTKIKVTLCLQLYVYVSDCTGSIQSLTLVSSIIITINHIINNILFAVFSGYLRYKDSCQAISSWMVCCGFHIFSAFRFNHAHLHKR